MKYLVFSHLFSLNMNHEDVLIQILYILSLENCDQYVSRTFYSYEVFFLNECKFVWSL